MSTLTLIDLQKRFGEVTAVQNINLEVKDGEFLCILGPSGCGKSTALRMVAGFEEPSGGDILIDGASVVNLPANRRPTAMVFQKYTLWPHMRVFDNIAFGLKLRNLPKDVIERKVQDALALVSLPNYGRRFPNQLSGGEQQRVALARALVLEPKLLLLDEPFSNLDALLRVRLREELRRIQRQTRITAVFVTHDQEEALSLADRIAVMSKGRIEQLDKPSAIYAHPATLFVADFIGTMNLLPASQSGSEIVVGGHCLAAAHFEALDGAHHSGAVTLAIRPEDFALSDGADADGAWRGEIEQVIDLGHYRKALVTVAGLPTLKVYLPKARAFSEGEMLALTASRYLVYRDGAAPVEVRQRSAGDALRLEAV
jgi:putative spermidine/putrescine transport system ATP-binding protein